MGFVLSLSCTGDSGCRGVIHKLVRFTKVGYHYHIAVRNNCSCPADKGGQIPTLHYRDITMVKMHRRNFIACLVNLCFKKNPGSDKNQVSLTNVHNPDACLIELLAINKSFINKPVAEGKLNCMD